MDFLEQHKYVVIDFETTGNRAKDGDEIIQIGMCVIEKGKIIEKFSSFVKPSVKIPAFIEQLTGITDQDVQNAPPIEDVLPEVIKRLDNACFVAHNVHFDLSFYQSMLAEHGYYPFQGLILDTVELSRILLPEKDGYKLKQLSSAFDVEHEHPHQADSDALAAALLFIELCELLNELPLITIQRMIPISKTLHSDIDVLLRRVESTKILEQGSKQESPDIEIYRHFALRRRVDEFDKEATAEKSGVQNTGKLHLASEWLLWDEGDEIDLTSIRLTEILSRAVPDYEPREGQEAFFQQIIHSFQESKHGLAEVETGTGKTLAYLLASAYWAYVHQEKVVISTHTIPLQEQIMFKEWPVVKAALPFQVRVSVLKGKQHYACLRRLEQAFVSQQEERNYDQDLTKLQLLVWLTRTTTGDVEEINLTAGGREFWKRIQTEGSSCFQRDCPWFQRCFYYTAKRDAQLADIVVTNHALLITDENYGHALPAYRYAVIDEAHHLEQVTIDHLGSSIYYSALHSLFQRLIGVERLTLAEQLSDYFQLLLQGEELQLLLDQYVQELYSLKELLDQLFMKLYLFVRQKTPAIQEGNKRTTRIEHSLEKGKLWKQVLQIGELVQGSAARTFKSFYQLQEQLEQQAEGSSNAQKQDILENKRVGEQLESQVQALIKHLLQPELHENVYWYEYDGQGNRYMMSFHQRPLNVSSFMQSSFFEQKKSIVLTSATLQVKQSFQYVLDQLGLEEEELSLTKIPSPFDYTQQAKVIISEDISLLSEVSEEDFAKELAVSIGEIAQITEGRMLVLFTSYRLLKLTHEQLKLLLQDTGIFLYAQGIDSGSRLKLSKNFQSQEKAILLGTNSFWEGIDIPGEDLSCLVMVKLPFTPPNTPFYAAKAEELKRAEKNPFMDYALPQAVIRFKQGFGRLIRRASDRGIIVLFDRRIISARYGKVFLDSLPKVPVKVLQKAEMLTEIEEWFKKEDSSEGIM